MTEFRQSNPVGDPHQAVRRALNAAGQCGTVNDSGPQRSLAIIS